MADYNSYSKSIFFGRIAGEIKTRDTKKGTHIAWFDIATNEIRADTITVEFHRLVCFGKRADFIIKYGSKGILLYAETKPHNRSWKDEAGQIHTRTEFQVEELGFVGPKKQPAPPPKEGPSPENQGVKT